MKKAPVTSHQSPVTVSDRLLQLQSKKQLLKYYVPVSPGNNEYFTRYDLALNFARIINSTVKPL